MSFTAAQLAAIETAIASGVLIVDHQGTRTQYQSLDHLLKVRDMMRAELGTEGPRRSYTTYSRDGVPSCGTGDFDNA